MSRLVAILVSLLIAALSPATAAAHEVRPAYLQLDEVAPGSIAVLWKQPAMGDYAVHLEPHLSNGWLAQRPADQYSAGGYLVKKWRIADPSRRGVAGLRVEVEGLGDTMTDVLVRVHRLGEPPFTAILRPEAPQATIPSPGEARFSSLAFLVRGIEHILSGPDHLLFVLGLLLIVPGRRALIKTITAFTAAHSISLAIATLGHMALSTPLLDALIGLSILFLAPEIMRAQRGGDSLTLRRPWLVAFAFGLLHGLGFASGLTSLELGKAELASALLLFNLGVEIGQLAFVGVVLALARAVQLAGIRHWPAARQVPTYLVGSLGAFWIFQNAFALFSGAA